VAADERPFAGPGLKPFVLSKPHGGTAAAGRSLRSYRSRRGSRRAAQASAPGGRSWL